MTILILILMTILMTGTMSCVCFLIGAKVGQKVSKGEAVELPSVNPIKAYRENKEQKEAQMEQDKLDTIMRNIEKYDGTSRGQEDVG
jgi:hypothetical protein